MAKSVKKGGAVAASPANPRTKSVARRMGRKPVPENESRADRFKRIGAKRMNAAIRQIQLLGNLANPNYECNGDDLALMRDTIIHELESAMARFSPRKRSTATGFTFESPGQTTH